MHVSRTYSFDRFSKGFVEILAAEQTLEHSGWYEGTADAVRKNFVHFKTQNPSHYIILSGDQLYKMDLEAFMEMHLKTKAKVTIATTKVSREDATGFGIMKIDKANRITAFMEKPAANLDISDWKIPNSDPNHPGKDFLASMGIYIFDADVLEASLDNELTDFGKEVIPAAIKKYKVSSYVYDGYWEDIGTIKNFYDATIDLTKITPKFNFFDEEKPIYTHFRNLPPSKLNKAVITQSTASEGCVITEATISDSVIGIRSIIEKGTVLEGVVCMGADFYENEEEKAENSWKNIPNVGIGENCKIRNAIIDKNARIGANSCIGMCAITPKDGDYGDYVVADGIIVIKKNATIPSGTEI
jgi:glucose-1-phosphate adenylyltransferase